MSAIPPGDPLFSRKQKPTKEQANQGSRSTTNIKWTYNFEPLKKWALIIFGALALAISTWNIRNEALLKMNEEAMKQEAETARKEYLIKALEKLKQKTIAEAQEKRR